MTPTASISLAGLLLLASPGGPQEETPPEHAATCPRTCALCRTTIEKGLRYLLEVQNQDGSWGRGSVMSYALGCGLALLAEGSSARKGRFRGALSRFSAYLQKEIREDGSLEPENTCETWLIALAALALSELHQRDGDPGLRPKLEALGSYLARLQTGSGGWFHGRKPLARYSTDLVAVTNFAVLALKALERAGIPVPQGVSERARGYYRKLQNEDGGFPYGIGHPMKVLESSAGGRTTGAWLAMSLLGMGKEVERAAAYLKSHPETLTRGKVHGDFAQFFWLGAHVCRAIGGGTWKGFVARYLQPLARAQSEDGCLRLEKIVERLAFGCSYWETAMGLLALQAPEGKLSFLSLQEKSPEDPLDRATAWLLRSRKGKIWTARFGGEDCDILLTSLAGFALLAGGSTLKEGPHHRALAAAARHLSEQADGYRSHWCFQYPFALAFLAELHRIDPREELAGAMKKLIGACGRYQCPDGGFKYGDPKKLAIFSSNPATTYCVLFGLALARRAGMEVPGELWRKALAYLESHRNEDGSYRYGRRTQLVTTIGALAALHVAREPGAEFQKSLRRFEAMLPEFFAEWRTGLAGHHAGELALFFGSILVQRLGGRLAETWQQRLGKKLPSIQSPEGFFEIETQERRRGTALSRQLATAVTLFALHAPERRLPLLRAGQGEQKGKNTGKGPRKIGKAPASGERGFDARDLDPERWGLPGEAKKRLPSRLRLGKAFFTGKDRRAFLKSLRGAPPDERPEIGWVVKGEGRYLGCLLSRTPAGIRAMSDRDFEEWRRTWSALDECEWRRLHPLPGEIKGYGSPEKKAEILQTTRDLISAKNLQDFLGRTEKKAGGGHLSLLFVPRAGQGPTWYSLPFGQLKALDEEGFQLWRRRFLRWVEIHTPGQSRVTLFATLSEEAFEEEFRKNKARFGARDIRRALARFESRTGLSLRFPDYAAGKTSPVLSKTPPSSPLHPGDRILRVEGIPTPEWPDFLHQCSAWTPFSTLELGILPPEGDEPEIRHLTLPERKG